MTVTRRATLVTAAVLALAASLAPSAHSATVPLSGTLDLPVGADVTLTGEKGTAAGSAVAPAGDVNGDGSLDLLVGDPLANPARRDNAGSVFVVFGPVAGLPTDLARLGSRGIRIDGAAAGDRLGTAAAPAGDVNGDGLADVVLGAPRGDDEKDFAPGSAYLVLGRREAGQIDLANRGAGELRLHLGSTFDHLGATVGAAPDMDGDRRPEVLVGADRAGYDNGPTAPLPAGAAFVVFSRTLSGDVDLANLGDRGVRLDGAAGSGAGLGLAGAPDLNGDGRGEVLVGAPTFGARSPEGSPRTPPASSGAGRAYVVFGRATGGRVDLAGLGDAGITVVAAPGDGFLGISPFPLGDVTGDGIADLAFGAPLSDRNERVDAGSVDVVAGQRGPGVIDLGVARPGFRVDGGVGDDRLGSWIDTAPDINGDGRPELLLAARGADPLSRTDAGAAYVLFGQERPRDVDLATLREEGYRIAGPAAKSTLGSVAGLGDIDGDGRGDLIAGAGGAGSAHLILGPKPPPVPVAPPDEGVAEEVAAGCLAATNVEVIIDDSGSMSDTDPSELRRLATELLITKPRSEGKVLGVYEFGSEGAQVIAPTLIVPRGVLGSNKPKLIEAVEKATGADNGGTNYNLGLKGAVDDNPAAMARIFITDGAHNEGEYTDQHRGGPPTYVIGLGRGAGKGELKARLDRIAAETKGRSYTGVTAENIVAVVNRIDSRLNCDLELDTDVDTLTLDDPVDEQVVDLDPNARTLDVDVSWGDVFDDVEPEEIAFLRDGRVVGRASARRLREIVARPGRTFTVGGIELKGTERPGRFGLRLTGLRADSVRVRYRVRKARGKGARVTSQVGQSRRRLVEQSQTSARPS
jgi:hypothetical protein